MPNVTLYVKDADLELVNEAKTELGDSLSSIYIDCLREKLARKKAVVSDAAKMEKITLVFWNENEQPVIKKSFTGRWLVGGPDEGTRADDETQDWDAGGEWSVAQTQKGAIVVYTRHCNDGFAPGMEIFESFEDLRDAKHSGGWAKVPGNIIASVADELGEPYEIELDI